MTNWITHQNSTIDLDLVQSFNIEYISFKQEYIYNNRPDGSLWRDPTGHTPPPNYFAIIFHFNNHKAEWKFDSNEEAQKVFTSLQQVIGVNIKYLKDH